MTKFALSLACLVCCSRAAVATPLVFSDGGFDHGVTALVSSPFLGGTASGTASNWTAQVTGLIGLGASAGTVDTGDSVVGRLRLQLGVGASAALSRQVTTEFLASTDYDITLNVRSSSLALLSLSGLSVEVLDGNNVVVASLWLPLSRALGSCRNGFPDRALEILYDCNSTDWSDEDQGAWQQYRCSGVHRRV